MPQRVLFDDLQPQQESRTHTPEEIQSEDWERYVVQIHLTDCEVREVERGILPVSVLPQIMQFVRQCHEQATKQGLPWVGEHAETQR